MQNGPHYSTVPVLVPLWIPVRISVPVPVPLHTQMAAIDQHSSAGI